MLGNDDLPDQSQPDGCQPSADKDEARPASAYRDQPEQGQPKGRPLALEDEAQASKSQAASGPTSQEGDERDDTSEATAARLEGAGDTISSAAGSQTRRNEAGTSEFQAAHPNKLEDILCDPTAKAF